MEGCPITNSTEEANDPTEFPSSASVRGDFVK